ncbi:iron(III) transport system ATP-binding protein [Vibrio crassostreae]|uniref:ABC transporter ATP-binding protein n=1 Tax=Vibrio crassostreae TaxID=246167 RepID=UPI001BD5A2EC|nr:ABC transporter ATP-binding protein [Vibrio crassostreae]CAK2075680.1 iron(III) transport system ATP-binding protein [Vibrio crassostreae]CAK2130208.1 iron(III) transport system ATP-binding protein [Vibrio crassostreae]CAK2287638.1 iron(III) transport system ATP-binding protein [Vibrio crassostreae]CAK2291178.1 iron(III) transport system ATP-binding protein [Vibrio crassostreae]CAK2370339.1 iron(III) transport system ATP-binding protein [Vibrio crassostreae]
MSCALSIKDLTCKYESQTILEALSLEVEHGEIVCLLGASGCGKTTLLKAIAGLLPLSSGVMSLNCQTIDDGDNWLPPEQRNIGMIFQDYALFPHLTVNQNVGFGLKELSEQQKKEKVQEMLELVHLDEYGDRYPHQLSGGQQQRVAIARSLAYKPDLLLLDEPFSNIDTQVRHELISQIRKIFKKQGVTAIFVTHSREEAFAFADKMAVMNHGVIEQYGSASELYFHPSSKFVADFLGGGSYLKAQRISNNEFETSLGLIEAKAQTDIEMGADCALLLRPQHIVASHDVDSNLSVLEQQFMGDHCRYVIEANGQKLLSTSSEALEVGMPVTVKVDTKGVLAF